ncbi:QcrA and Rieske domain-containing protein [Angustibacter luteus]|uniref:Cytochrome bc1 complex Rieske iron-sulfur subunit n=1 Tax=Angustibacter luteus TaxID=658456 RepID=A0ABW1JGJ3_9ACTN
MTSKHPGHPLAEAERSGPVLPRRPVLGAGLAIAATTVVAACGSGDDAAPSAGASSSSSSSSSSDGGSDPTAAPLAQVADIPVGGAVSAQAADGTKILLTQPTAGEVVGLNAKCTHMGCTVAPGDKQLDCPCHQSSYDLTGKNISGPAPKPLAAFPVKVEGGAVVPA